MSEVNKHINAIGNFVILRSIAKSAGNEVKSVGGIVIETAKENKVGEIPLVAEVVSMGHLVPLDVGFKVGDIVPVPNGSINHLPHPEVVKKKAKHEELDEKFVSCHYSFITNSYGNILEEE